MVFNLEFFTELEFAYFVEIYRSLSLFNIILILSILEDDPIG